MLYNSRYIKCFLRSWKCEVYDVKTDTKLSLATSHALS